MATHWSLREWCGPDGGRREIDMVIATGDEILFVEQKHWSVIHNNRRGSFFQKRKNGGTLLHRYCCMDMKRVSCYALCMRKELVNLHRRVRSF